MAKKIIFTDLDGTLLDTLEDIADSTNAALASMGFPVHEVQSFRTLVGDGMETLVRKALPENARDQATLAECQSRLRDEYGRRLEKAVHKGHAAVVSGGKK